MKSTKNEKIKKIKINPAHGRSRGGITAQYVQHLCYLPFGEEWLNQQNSAIDYKSRYTFSGKERDSETGYSYFGARYYSSDYSIWLSVDPLSDKYPSMSPYMYCGGNPVRLVDVDGREWLEPIDVEKCNELRKRAVAERGNYKEGSDEYNRIQEGIDGLDFMTQDKERKYTFTELYKDSYDTESTTAGYVKREGKDPANGTYHICYRDDNNFSNFSDSEMGKAWHETVHLTRMLEEHDIPYREWAKTGGRQSNDGIIGYLMGPNDRLSCCTENIHHEEYAAYRSQQLVFPNSMPTPVGCVFGSIKTDTELNQYIKNNY